MRKRRSAESLRVAERLGRRRDFQTAYDEGRKMTSPFFVGFLVMRDSGPMRLGVVASRRVGGAVQRNRAKRVLREVFRLARPDAERSVDVVLVARRGIVEARFQDVERAYARTMGRALEANG